MLSCVRTLDMLYLASIFYGRFLQGAEREGWIPQTNKVGSFFFLKVLLEFWKLSLLEHSGKTCHRDGSFNAFRIFGGRWLVQFRVGIINQCSQWEVIPQSQTFFNHLRPYRENNHKNHMIRCNYFAVWKVCWNNKANLRAMIALLQGPEIKRFKVTAWRGKVQCFMKICTPAWIQLLWSPTHFSFFFSLVPDL